MVKNTSFFSFFNFFKRYWCIYFHRICDNTTAWRFCKLCISHKPCLNFLVKSHFKTHYHWRYISKFKKKQLLNSKIGVPIVAQQKRIWLISMRMWVWFWLHSVGWGSGVAVSCGLGHRRGSDPMLLWLWWRLAAAARIPPLAWELPCAVGAALKKSKINKQTTTTNPAK